MARNGDGVRSAIAWMFAAATVALLAIGVVAAAAEPQVLQPDSTAFSSAERAALLRELAELEGLLESAEWGSARSLGERGWGSYEFALYAAGTLEGLGYETAVVTSASWSGGAHTWVLVGVSVGGRLAWIPVEATPKPGIAQRTLGFVPKLSAVPGQFDDRYIAFDQIASQPVNRPPVPQIRPPTSFVLVREFATFLGLSSYDPDGEIILYQWKVDGGRATSSQAHVYNHSFDSPGQHTVALTVVDDRGGRASVAVAVEVLSEKPEGDKANTGCGCGG